MPDSKDTSDVIERGPWIAVQDADDDDEVGETYIESQDFIHDARLYINGDFEDQEDKLDYAIEIAKRLNAMNPK